MEILIGILGVAALVDILHYKIPNLCIVAGMAAGLYMTYMSYHIAGIWQVVIQIIVVFAVFYPFYLFHGLGAGDVKLFMLLGCYMDKGQLWNCIAISMLFAGIVALIKIIRFRENRENLLYLGRYIRKVLYTGTFDEYEVRKYPLNTVRLSVPTLCSVLLLTGGGIL